MSPVTTCAQSSYIISAEGTHHAYLLHQTYTAFVFSPISHNYNCTEDKTMKDALKSSCFLHCYRIIESALSIMDTVPFSLPVIVYFLARVMALSITWSFRSQLDTLRFLYSCYKYYVVMCITDHLPKWFE